MRKSYKALTGIRNVYNLFMTKSVSSCIYFLIIIIII